MDQLSDRLRTLPERDRPTHIVDGDRFCEPFQRNESLAHTGVSNRVDENALARRGVDP